MYKRQPLLTSNDPPVGAEPMSLETVSWIGSINYLGSVLGAVFWGQISDHFGRKHTAFILALPFVFSWLMTLSAQNPNNLIVARVIAGVDCSGAIINTPVYITEIASDKIRGTLGSYFMLFFNAGCLFSYTIGAFVSYHTMAAVCLAVPIVYLLSIVWLPESLVYLWTHDKKAEAEKSLLWFRGDDTVHINDELNRLKPTPIQERQVGWKELMKTKGMKKAMSICVILVFAQHMSGILAILTYAVLIFQQTGSSITPHASAIMLVCLQLIAVLFSSTVVDMAGRKILLLTSMISTRLCLSVLGVYLYFKDDTWNVSVYGWIPVLSLSLHVLSFALGTGSVSFVVMSEIYLPEIRGRALSQTHIFSTVLSFTLARMFPLMKRYLHLYGCFWFFSV